eukprot:2824950-Pyramimonas_sp.AAC.1
MPTVERSAVEHALTTTPPNESELCDTIFGSYAVAQCHLRSHFPLDTQQWDAGFDKAGARPAAAAAG